MSEGITGNQLVEGVVSVIPKTVTLNNAQIKALPTTPFEIVPAPGEGKVIRWLGAWIIFDNSAGGYDIPPDTPFWQLVYLTAPFAREASGLVFPALNVVDVYSVEVPPFAGFNATEGYLESAPTGSAADVENVGLALADIYNGLSDYTGGNAANTLKVTVLYTVVDA